jgi:endonuclease YncB( thermonuclease family)
MKRTLSAILIAACSAPALQGATTKTAPLPFLADDYPRALSQARAKKLPIFAEAWAPW